LTGITPGRILTPVLNGQRFLGAALVAAMVLSLGAQCLAGHEMTAAQMACCVGTDHDCRGVGAAEDCCQSEHAERDQLVAHLQQPVSPPARVNTAIAAFVEPVDARGAAAVALDTPSPIANSPPRYVLLETFLI
jgi:hypothetical protein